MTGGALEGLKVLDFSRVLAGPYATMMLADFGALVTKIERSGVGDETRAWGPPLDDAGTATYFNAVNRNKTSVEADLRNPDDVDNLRALGREADVVIENFRAGTMERYGLGYDDLKAINPGLIYCSITGFGTGAGAVLPGFDLLVQAVGGLMSITGSRAEEPTKAGVAVVDVITGMHAVAGILTALVHRSNTGEGQRVEVNLMSSLLSGLVNQASGYLGAGVVPKIMGNAHPSIAPYEVFDTADRPLVVAVGTDGQFRQLADALGVPELAADPRFTSNAARVAHREPLNQIISARLRAATADDWFRTMTSHGVPAGPINSVAEAFEFAQTLGLRPIVDMNGQPQIANPISLSATPAQYQTPPPPLGNGNLSTRRAPN